MNGRSLLTRSLETIISSGVASAIVVAAPEDFLFRAREEIAAAAKKSEISITAVAGGSDRTASVQIALKHIGDAEFVLVHDAARCLTPVEVFSRVLSALQSGVEAVVPVLPMIDTVRRALPAEPHGAQSHSPDSRRAEPHGQDSRPAVPHGADRLSAGAEVLRGDLDRSLLRRVQTPQGFRAATLVRAYAQHRADSAPATDDAGLVERLGVDVMAVGGHEEALKITYPLDRILAEQLARMRDGQAADSTIGTGEARLGEARVDETRPGEARLDDTRGDLR